MNKSDTHRQIAALTRRSHEAAMYAVAYLTTDLTHDRLEELLAAMEEFQQATRSWVKPVDHLAAFEERFGRRPV